MPPYEAQVEQVRSFNRFYTRQIGVLREGLLETPFSLTQARVLYEVGQRPGMTATSLVEELGLDAGYVSRLLKSFEGKGLVRRARSRQDGRIQQLMLTAKGRGEFARLDARSRAETREVLSKMNAAARERLVESMGAIRELLEAPGAPESPVVIRTHRPGDIGWVIARHGELYAQEYQFNSSFEGLVAEIAGAFLQNFDSERERCWIAERDGARLGSVFLVKKSNRVGKLRLLLVEPSARGLGIGKRLVNECVEFARASGYRKLTLWTQDILHTARSIYERAGFRLATEEKHHSFGLDLTGQFWELQL